MTYKFNRDMVHTKVQITLLNLRSWIIVADIRHLLPTPISDDKQMEDPFAWVHQFNSDHAIVKNGPKCLHTLSSI